MNSITNPTPRPSPTTTTRFSNTPKNANVACKFNRSQRISTLQDSSSSSQRPPIPHFINAKPLIDPTSTRTRTTRPCGNREGRTSVVHVAGGGENKQVLSLCGFGYWVQGLRCFPWLALNFHMAQDLNLQPSTLQLVQYTAALPMVAKPLYGLLSDALCVGHGGAHRVPYISFGVIPVVGETFSAKMACILASNLGASLTEVASDALIAEFSKTCQTGDLQSYAFMALAAGGMLGNFSGGFFLLRTRQPKILFLIFCLLLSFQLAIALTTKEISLDSQRFPDHHLVQGSLSDNLSKQFSDLITAVNEERIYRPLLWVVASIAVVPMLSGTTFCFQTQSLKLDPSIIGISKVNGQLIVLAATIIYNRCLKWIPMRKLVCGVQVTYAISMLSDIFLVKQINIKLGISNEAYVLCVSALAEAVAQFKILPFSVLLANLCPPGCEGSLIAFLTSSLCLSSIFSGFFGVFLAHLIGISSEDYSNLPMASILQCFAALLPLGWISHIPTSRAVGKRRQK